ncbi:MAG: hypothetical protein VB137_10910 [Burkholderia sp.]
MTATKLAVDASTLYAAFKMPPEQATAFLKSKGVVVSDGWTDLWREAHSRAFTVAQSAGFDIVSDVHDALVKALEDGQTYESFRRDLEPVLRAKGSWGKAIDADTGEITRMYPGTTRPVEYGTSARLRLIYEQNVQTAYMAGRYRSMMQAVDLHPYWAVHRRHGQPARVRHTRPCTGACSATTMRRGVWPFHLVAGTAGASRYRCRQRT